MPTWLCDGGYIVKTTIVKGDGDRNESRECHGGPVTWENHEDDSLFFLFFSFLSFFGFSDVVPSTTFSVFSFLSSFSFFSFFLSFFGDSC